jgi:ankyrin repeat protein
MPEPKEMIKAAKTGDAARVGELLAEDPSLLHARDADGSTPLHCAAWKGHAEVARVLLDAGADHSLENDNTHWGGTPLHAAAHGNQKVVAELLIARGADVRLCSFNGRTPLEETIIHQATAVAKLLAQHGAAEEPA